MDGGFRLGSSYRATAMEIALVALAVTAGCLGGVVAFGQSRGARDGAIARLLGRRRRALQVCRSPHSSHARPAAALLPL